MARLTKKGIYCRIPAHFEKVGNKIVAANELERPRGLSDTSILTVALRSHGEKAALGFAPGIDDSLRYGNTDYYREEGYSERPINEFLAKACILMHGRPLHHTTDKWLD